MKLKNKIEIDKQLSMNWKCLHPDIKEEEVLRADQEGESPYAQIIKRCTKCKKEII